MYFYWMLIEVNRLLIIMIYVIWLKYLFDFEVGIIFVYLLLLLI